MVSGQNVKMPGFILASGEVAYLAGGPFWSMDAIFKRVPGIFSVTSGFSGGVTDNPTYVQVCDGKTGHCEVVKVEFDLKKLSFEQLLEIFWEAHDPTKSNTSFEIGKQYRSMIFYHSEYQKLVAELSREKAQAGFPHPIVTEILAFKKFYPAETRHQGYYDKNTDAPYCQIIVAPRLQALETKGILPRQPGADSASTPAAA